MTRTRNIIVLWSLLLFTLSVSAQTATIDTSFVLSGKIFHPKTMKGIANAHILVDETRRGTICDSLGFFRLRVYPNQHLNITAIGFSQETVPVPIASLEGEAFIEIPLKRESYLLEEVMVYSLGTWEQFKYNFIHSKAPKDSGNIAAAWKMPNIKKVAQSAKSMRRGGLGVSAGIFGHTKKDKSRLKVAKMEVEDYYLSLLHEKYNPTVVSQLTGEKGKRLDALMVYINDRHMFTHQTSQYYIGLKIKAYYKNFLEKFPYTAENYASSDSVTHSFPTDTLYNE